MALRASARRLRRAPARPCGGGRSTPTDASTRAPSRSSRASGARRRHPTAHDDAFARKPGLAAAADRKDERD
eukprot:scaffold96_cov302-Prasinococcus_capsulatus_cf.AAC.15